MAFIDLRLQYDGRVNRTDLTRFFEVSPPQASADLGLYQGIAQGNMSYDASAKAYVATPGFQPQFGRASAGRYLDELYRLASGVIESDESFVGFIPPTGIVATPMRSISSAEVATWVQAIRDQRAVGVEYQSMEHEGPLELVLSPHAIGFDGLRWHVRAWCHMRKRFRDFAIGRLQVTAAHVDAESVDPATDLSWNTLVDVILVPHSNLTKSQREAVMKDYGMTDGRLVLPCRKAMLFYTLRHLNLQALKEEDDAPRQHVVVNNAQQVEAWLVEDRLG